MPEVVLRVKRRQRRQEGQRKVEKTMTGTSLAVKRRHVQIKEAGGEEELSRGGGGQEDERQGGAER